MPQAAAIATITAYYAAFNAADMPSMLALLDTEVIHDISQGAREQGRDRFARFMDHMNRCYREHLDDLVVMADATGTRAAAEFTVHGTYLATDPGVPAGTAAARGQTYTLPAGAFFELRSGRITRVSNHYNLGDWIAQIT
jgi:steroid delta-isomerase-like uncharacterized protein